MIIKIMFLMEMIMMIKGNSYKICNWYGLLYSQVSNFILILAFK